MKSLLFLALSLIYLAVLIDAAATPAPTPTATPAPITPTPFQPPPVTPIPTVPIDPLNPVVARPGDRWSEASPRVRLHVAIVPTPQEGAFLSYTMVVNGRIVALGIPGSSISGYISLGSDVTDTLYNVQVFRSDSPIPIASQEFRFTGGEDYTINIARNALGRAVLAAIVDDNGNYGTARIRVISNAQGITATNMQLGIVTAGIFTPIITNINPTDITDYVNIPTPGIQVQLALRPTPPAVGNAFYFNPFFLYPSTIFVGGATYTFFVGGDSDILPGGANSFGASLSLDSFGENIPINPFASPNTARVRLGLASTANPLVEVALLNNAGLVAATGLVASGGFSNYFAIPAGFYTAQFSSGGVLLASRPMFFTGSKDYSLVYTVANGAPVVLDMLDNNVLPRQGHAHVRFINVIDSPFSPLIDIDLEHYPVVRRLKHFGVTPYIPIDISQPPKNIPIEIVESKGMIRSLFYLPDFEVLVASGNVYTFLVQGFQAPGLVQLFPTFDAGVGLLPQQVASDAIDAQIQELIFENQGVSVSAALSDNAILTVPIIWAKAYGWSNLDNARRATRTTKYIAGSISSLLVSTAVLRAINESKFTLDSDVSGLLNFRLRNPRQNDRAIRVHHLLTHTSTIVDNWDEIKKTVTYREDPIIGVCEFIESYLLEDGRYFDRDNWLSEDEGRIGRKFEFSHVGSAVLACIIEQTYNKPFSTYARDHIFTKTLPKRMRRSNYLFAELRSFKRSAKSYVFINANQTEALNLTGAGWAGLNRFMLPIYPVYNLLTTPTDILLFFHNIFLLNGGQILTPAGVAMISEDTSVTFNNQTMTTAGWIKTTTLVPGRTLVGHSAWTAFGDDNVVVGFDGHAYWDVSGNTGAAIFANTADSNGWLRTVYRLIFDQNNIWALRFAYGFPPGCQRFLTEQTCNANPDCTWIREGRPGSICAKKVVEKPQPFAGQFGRAN